MNQIICYDVTITWKKRTSMSNRKIYVMFSVVDISLQVKEELMSIMA